ncbi:MAG: UvrB/UvrC motif-containing protein [bacterium]|nr:UvrB/UvrC motif-containing protein [bacterium]
MTLEQFSVESLPRAPGVYFFKRGLEVLYIGKATSLRDRVRSYFNDDVISTRGLKIVNMIILADSVEWKETESVLEALILESHLIKKNQPEFNTRDKDDKSYSYILITDEEFPRIMQVRGKTLAEHNAEPKKHLLPKQKYLFGPFPKGSELKSALHIVRKIFPYRDKCVPVTGKPCFNAQIGLCPGVCSGVVSKREYARTVNHLRLLFAGKKRELLKELTREMKIVAKEERFEDAQNIKRQITGLEHVNDIALIKRRAEGVLLMAKQGGREFRIEAYDVAHLQGSARVGVMTVVSDGEPKKSDYRKFKLEPNRIDDTGGIREMLKRRLAHSEWPLPSLIVVDGAIAQKRVAEAVLKEAQKTIPVIAVTKDEKHKPKALLGLKKYKDERTADILLANAEAHRFAITFHRARRDRL